MGNCNAWTSDGLDFGTYAYLPSNWTTGQDIHIWEVSETECESNIHVWCVADDVVGAPVYLPLILRNFP
jgi:hypothetical protein